MIIKADPTSEGTVEEKAVDPLQDAWGLDEDKEETIYVSKEESDAQVPGPEGAPQVPPPVLGSGDLTDLRESLQTAYASFENQYLRPWVRSSCEYANISPQTAEFLETPIAISLAFALACCGGSLVLISLGNLTSLLTTFMYHVIIQGIVFYWKVLGTLLMSAVLFVLTSATMVTGKLILRSFEPFSHNIRDPAMEGLRRAAAQDWPAIGRYIWEHLLVAIWAVQSTVVDTVQRYRQRRSRGIRARRAIRKGGKFVAWAAMLLFLSSMRVSFWLVSLACFLWARKRRSATST